MNEIESDPKQAAALAQQIVGLLIEEPSETRLRAIHGALVLLGEQSISRVKSGTPSNDSNSDDGEGRLSLAEFFNREDGLKASDYVYLCAAYYFSIHGPITFGVKDLQEIASEAGVMLPNRVDVTLHSASIKGKKLFQPVSKGAFKPTVAAGAAFKERWGVKPGKLPKASPLPSS